MTKFGKSLGRTKTGVTPTAVPMFSKITAFTLIELMAVVLVILLLAAISLGVAGYVQKRMAISATRAQLAALETALENYKSDWGYYPSTSFGRVSANGFYESTNNWILYNALAGLDGRKQYLRCSPSQLRVNIATGSTNSTRGGLMNICDAWGTPFTYYCAPNMPSGVSNGFPTGWPALTFFYGGYAVGGQVNVSSYDLMSYGADKSTYVPGAVAYGGGYNYAWYFGAAGDRWTNMTKALDDITNFGR